MASEQSHDQHSSLCYRGRFLDYLELDGWEYVSRRRLTGVVGVLALSPEGKLIMVRQYRKPVGKYVIELPAGLAGDVPRTENEALEVAAQRELEEETGYHAEKFTFLCHGPSSAGLTDECITLFRAEKLTRLHEGGGDEHEDIEVIEKDPTEVMAWLSEQQQAGDLIDFKVYSGLAFL